jgi:predicted NBD/HSP70 family sugar kinase
MLLRPGEPPYVTKDKRGDVEQFLSGTAMGRRCKEADSPDEYLKGDTCAFMHPDILKEIAWLATNIIHTLNPSVLIFGGSAGRALKPHLEGMKEALLQWTLPGTPLPELKIAELSDAAVRGAALICGTESSV